VKVSGPAKTPRLLDGTAQIDQFKVTLEGMPLTSKGPIRASLNDGVVKLNQLEIDAEDTTLVAAGTADLLGDGGMNVQAHGGINAKLAQSFNTEISSSGHIDFNLTAQGALKTPDLEGQFNFKDVNLAYQAIPNGISHLNGAMVFNQDRLELRNLVGITGGGTVTLGGFLIYQQGIFGDVTVALKNTRFRYAGLSSSADANLRLYGTQSAMTLSGNILITRFLVGQNVDFAALTGGAGAVSPPPDPNAFGNRVRLDVHITSAPQMDFQNSFAQIAGSVNLRIRGTAAQPAVLGRINISDGNLQRNHLPVATRRYFLYQPGEDRAGDRPGRDDAHRGVRRHDRAARDGQQAYPHLPLRAAAAGGGCDLAADAGTDAGGAVHLQHAAAAGGGERHHQRAAERRAERHGEQPDPEAVRGGQRED
jgi:translocation and assembly module TamB